ADLSCLTASAKKAHEHLMKVISHDKNRIALSLEWVRLPYQNKAVILKINKIARQINTKYENVLFLGIGGSYLGLKAAQDALLPAYYNDFCSLRKNNPRVYFEGNNLDPDTLSVLLKNLNPKKTFVVVISKSGETTETKAAFMAVENWLENNVGKNSGRQILAITDPQSGTLRQRINQEQNRDKLSFRSLPLFKGVGGRFSEFNMGLLHLAICGVDIQKVLAGARDMAKQCENPEILKNPAYMYALLHHILDKKGKSLAIMMPFAEGLKATADWYCQLLAESLGKKFSRKITVDASGLEVWLRDKNKAVNVGRTPVAARGTNDLHSIQQNNIEGKNDKVVTFIRVEKFKNDIKIQAKNDLLSQKNYSGLIKLAQEATEWALVRESRPNCTIILPEVSPYYWGGLLYFLEMATAFEGELLDINAFDQPGVEGYKNYIYFKLHKPGMPEEITSEIKGNPLIKKSRFII
ncbi:MAG: glucose-6-phosphate isomerase, partial [Candidatus Omnitrophota bacterium]